MKNDYPSDGDNADVIPFAFDNHTVDSKVNKGLQFSKSFLSETYDDKVIDDILQEYYDIFENDLSFEESAHIAKSRHEYQKIKDSPKAVLAVHQKIEDLQRQISGLEDEIRYYLYEIKSHLPFKK